MTQAERPIDPSVTKHGTIVNEDGFTQIPRSLEDYLHSLDLCSTAILLVFILLSYRWEAEQESYPSVRTLAARCGVTTRRINQLTSQLCAAGLLIKTERFSDRSQISNYYDLEPLFNKVAAWKNTEIAVALAEEETQADLPFQPQDVLEQAAQIVSEEFGEPTPRQQRYNARRLRRRWEQHILEWETFADIIERAVQQTETRAAEPTRAGQAFTKLIPYFFSAMDYRLSKMQPVPQVTTRPQAAQKQSSQVERPTEPQSQGQGEALLDKGQQPRKTGLLAERARERKEDEAQGRRKVRAPETLKVRIEAAALTFRDKAVKSSVQRAANLMDDARLDEQTMVDLVADARAAASKATNVKNRMPYFFSILEERVSKFVEDRVQ